MWLNFLKQIQNHGIDFFHLHIISCEEKVRLVFIIESDGGISKTIIESNRFAVF